MELPPALQDRLKKLRFKLDKIPAFQTAEEVTKVPKEYIACGGGLVAALLVLLSIGAGSLCSLVGFMYPAYKSFEAIESKSASDDTQWLIYWVVYAFFSIIEVFAEFLLYWIPFYYAFKMAFLLWAMLPQTRGAKYLYDAFLKDFLKKNESKIDAALNEAKRNAKTIVTEAVAATAEVTSAGAAKATEIAKNLNENAAEEKKDK